jgi:hypothetical protein
MNAAAELRGIDVPRFALRSQIVTSKNDILLNLAVDPCVYIQRELALAGEVCQSSISVGLQILTEAEVL